MNTRTRMMIDVPLIDVNQLTAAETWPLLLSAVSSADFIAVDLVSRMIRPQSLTNLVWQASMTIHLWYDQSCMRHAEITYWPRHDIHLF